MASLLQDCARAAAARSLRCPSGSPLALPSRRRRLPERLQTLAAKQAGCCQIVAAVADDRGPKAGSKQQRQPRRERRLLSVAPLLLPAMLEGLREAELPPELPLELVLNDFHLEEATLKTFYLVFACVFCWGAVTFASMNDNWYESEEYRSRGGNGTQFYQYELAEEAEEINREELWRDELRREIEGKDLQDLELPSGEEVEEEEKAKEFV